MNEFNLPRKDLWLKQFRNRDGTISVQGESYSHIRTTGKNRNEILRKLHPIILERCSGWGLCYIKVHFRREIKTKAPT